MTDVVVRVKKDDQAWQLPAYQTAGAAGADVCSSETCVLGYNERRLVSTGLFLEVPPGYECQVRPRSGLAIKHGVTVFNSPGTIDSDYRGEVKVLLINLKHAPFVINRGDRIAQLVIAPVVQARFEEHNELSETSRGAGGWGSTGVR